DNINKLTNYKIRMDVSYTRGLEELNNMAEYKKLVEKSFLAIKYLIDVNVKLSKTQAYNKIFQWNWFDLETSVRPALGELLAEVNKREKRLRQEVEKVKLHSSNLGSNISLLESSICRINGTYTGNLSSGRQGNITLILNPDYGNSGSVTYSYRENNLNYSYTWTFPYITISSGQYISIKAKLGNKTANLSGRLSQDYMQILDFNGTDSHTSSSNIPSTTLRK
ncbi:MAG TPA: hypothetical protein VGE24_02400, partial [Emticicia sp.]